MTHQVKIEQNTFTFKTTDKKVICEQFTDFTGTTLEEDFPEGSTGIFEMPKDKRGTDKDNINKLIYKILKDYNKHKIKQTKPRFGGGFFTFKEAL